MASAFSEVKAELAKAEEAVADLSEMCASITARLHDARQTSSHLLQRTAELGEKRESVEAHRELVGTFLDKFQVCFFFYFFFV